jgi:hypothetical protein
MADVFLSMVSKGMHQTASVRRDNGLFKQHQGPSSSSSAADGRQGKQKKRAAALDFFAVDVKEGELEKEHTHAKSKKKKKKKENKKKNKKSDGDDTDDHADGDASAEKDGSKTSTLEEIKNQKDIARLRKLNRCV